MRKRKSTRETKNMIQTALWLPRDVHEKLKKEGGERGLGEEIRRRLEISFGAEQETRDELTDLLLDLIKKIALKISHHGEQWWCNHLAFDVLKAAINSLLSDLISALHPREEALPETMARLQSEYGPDAKPESIGPKLAHAVLVENATKALRLRSLDRQEA
jgi:hypothetical protein